MWIPQSQPPGSLWIFLSTHPSKRMPSSPTTLPSVPPPSHTLCLWLCLCPCPCLCRWLCLCLWSLSVSGSGSVCLCLCVGMRRGRRCRHLLGHALAHIFLMQPDASKVCMALRVQVLWCVCFGVERGSSRFFTASPLLDGPVNLSI